MSISKTYNAYVRGVREVKSFDEFLSRSSIHQLFIFVLRIVRWSGIFHVPFVEDLVETFLMQKNFFAVLRKCFEMHSSHECAQLLEVHKLDRSRSHYDIHFPPHL